MAERGLTSGNHNGTPHEKEAGLLENLWRALQYPEGGLLLFLRAIPLLLLASTVALGAWTFIEVRETVREDFNQQQLVLARQVAGRVGSSVQILRLELASLSESAADAQDVASTLPPLMHSMMRRVGTMGLVEVRYVDRLAGSSLVLGQDGVVVTTPYDDNDSYLLKQAEGVVGGANNTYIQDAPFAPRERPLMMLATSVYARGVGKGILYLLVDDRKVAGNAVAGIRSGRTGYAWVINADGIFLAHPVGEFVGQDAFEVREGRQPAISFARINEIQRYKMLGGDEGTSWYVSEARGEEDGGKAVEKLIAFAPIQVGGQGGHRNWSVAVVAPASEVESTVNGLLVKQLIALTPSAFAIALVLVLVVSGRQRQARELQRAVEAATLRTVKSEERYRMLVESADDLILTLTADGEIVSANRAALKLLARSGLNVTQQGIVGRHLQDLVSADTAQYLLAEVRAVVHSGRGTSHEHAFVVSDQEYWFNTKLRVLELSSEDGPAVLMIARDMTQKRLMDQQMFNTEKLASLGALAAGVAHEINNPLAAILGFTDLLLERFPPDSQEHRDLRVVEERGQHCLHIVENLLDYARIGTSLDESTNANEDIEMVLQLVSNTLLTRKITVAKDLAPGLPSIRGNSRELQQVFLNLVNNAIYAMRAKGGTLSVYSAVRGNRIIIRVGDTGTGIPPELQSRIFDPFFTTKGVGEGTGLGLSVSLGIVQKLGGTISVVSRTGNPDVGEQSGSEFAVTLPVLATAEEDNR